MDERFKEHKTVNTREVWKKLYTDFINWTGLTKNGYHVHSINWTCDKEQDKQDFLTKTSRDSASRRARFIGYLLQKVRCHALLQTINVFGSYI